jgi:hypothetical protein
MDLELQCLQHFLEYQVVLEVLPVQGYLEAQEDQVHPSVLVVQRHPLLPLVLVSPEILTVQQVLVRLEYLAPLSAPVVLVVQEDPLAQWHQQVLGALLVQSLLLVRPGQWHPDLLAVLALPLHPQFLVYQVLLLGLVVLEFLQVPVGPAHLLVRLVQQDLVGLVYLAVLFHPFVLVSLLHQ